MKLPGPDHPITVTASGKRYRARIHAHVIADTVEALVLQEASYPPVIYFPRQDVETGFMSQTAHVTHCPYKGDATHYSLDIDGQIVEKAAWSYQQPYPAMEAIKDRLAFYLSDIEVYEVSEDQLEHRERDPSQTGLHS